MDEPRAHDALSQFLDGRGLQNRELAERVQRLRRHPSVPSAAEISHWRCGRSVPHHDMRVWLELATEGAVPAEAWGEEKRKRKQEKSDGQV